MRPFWLSLALTTLLSGPSSVSWADPEFVDEPSQGLAPKLVREVATILVRLRTERVTILLVEQNARMALAMPIRSSC